MRFKQMSHLGLICLYLLFSSFIVSCSGQQGETQLEVSQDGEYEETAQNEDGEEGNQQTANEEGQQGNEEVAQEDGQQGDDSENYSNEDGSYEEMAQEDGEDANTEGDLNNIINQMNDSEEELAEEEAPLNEEPLQEAPMEEAVAEEVPMQEVPMQEAAMQEVPMQEAAMQEVPVQEVMSEEAPMQEEAPMDVATIPFQPGGSPAAAGLPELGSKMPYIVKHGDTLSKIAGKIYSDQSRWQEISNLSSLDNPNLVYPGDVVYYVLDEQSVQFATAYENAPRATVQVQQGDTLESIAQSVYGKRSAWRSIWRQNDNVVNPDELEAGSTLFYLTQESLAASLKTTKNYLKNIATNVKKKLKSNSFTTLTKQNNTYFYNNIYKTIKVQS